MDRSVNGRLRLPGALPPELAACAALRDVRLYGNLLAELAPLAGLPELTTRDVSGNRLRVLSGLARGLTTLDLSGNQLTELPGAIRELTRLDTLDLSGNALTSADALLGLRLTELHLDGNRLAEWPSAVAAMPTLRRFSALGNPAGDPHGIATEVREAVHAHTTGHADPAKQCFDVATVTFAFSLAVDGAAAIRVLVEQYYRRFRGISAAITLANGTRIELAGLSRKSALRDAQELHRLVDQLRAALARLPAEQADDAEAVAGATADLVARATKEKPNKKLVDVAVTGLRTLVDGLATISPIALNIVNIVNILNKLIGG